MYKGKIGVFEGAGYSSKGLYRAEIVGGVSSEQDTATAW